MAGPQPDDSAYAFAAPARLNMLCGCCKQLAVHVEVRERFCFECFGETYLRTLEGMGEDVSFLRAKQASDPVALGMGVAWHYVAGGHGHLLSVAEARPR